MPQNSKKLRVLLCEDEGITVMQLRKALELVGHEVVGETADGDTAILLAQTLQPDLILMDIHLAGTTNGVETLRVISQHQPIPTIMITAQPKGEYLQEALEAGARAYLIKPVMSEAVVAAIDIALAA